MSLFCGKRWLLYGVLGMLAFSAVGCKNQEKGSVSSQVTPKPTSIVTPDVTSTPIPTPTQKPLNRNPLNLGGYELYEGETILDISQNVQMLARIDEKIKSDDKFISGFTILSYEEDYILTQWLSAETEEAFHTGMECEQNLALIAVDTLEVVKTVTFQGASFVNRQEDVIGIEMYNENDWKVITYDYQLNKIAEMKTPSGTTGYFSSDGKRCYYTLDKKLYSVNAETDEVREVALNEKFIVESVNGVVTDDAGNEYVAVWGMAADYENYHVILNTATGKSVHVYKGDDRYSVSTNNTYIEYLMSDFYTKDWLVGVSKDRAYDYKWTGANVEIGVWVLKNQDIFFGYTYGSRMYFYLYRYETGELLGLTSFDISKMAPEGVRENFGEEDVPKVLAYVWDTPVYINANTLLVELKNHDGKQFFIEWKIAVDPIVANQMQVKIHQMGTVPSVDFSQMNNPLYVPGKLSDSLMPLRERADAMEETYGVEIYIGEECSNVLGNYVIKPLVDYDLLEESLDVLEVQMEKYPDNFFEQFSYDWIEGLDIYLASTLTGISDDVLDYAGGFKTLYNSKVLMVLDCTDTYGIVSTFHHELCHAIEEKIVNHSITNTNSLFSEETWNSLNPYDNMYTYTYANRGFEEYWKYAYNYGASNKNVYFVDDYAMTYPTEDRARLFESVMSTHLFDIDFEESPHLMKKLNYYANCIRETFDTSGWEDVPWEVYME